jgi:WD40 repeat protein
MSRNSKFVITVCFASCAMLGAYSQAQSVPDTSESALPGRSAASHELPSESMLPGQLGESAEVADHGSSLPSESELPHLVQKQVSQTSEDSLPSNGSNPSTTGNDSNATTNNVQNSQPVVPKNNTVRGELDSLLADSRDQTPWLRLVEAEHTASINALCFDQTDKKLFSAGNDKVVLGWTRRVDGRWTYATTYRWQVQRAERGIIRSIDEANGRLAIGGTSAEGQMGEIAVIDHVRNLWLPPAVKGGDGHRFEVHKVFWVGPERKQIASIDSANGVAIWNELESGAWEPRWLRRSGLQQTSRRHLAAFGNGGIIWQGQDAADGTWRLQTVDIASGKVTSEFSPVIPAADREKVLRTSLPVLQEFLNQKGVKADRNSMLQALEKSGRLRVVEAARNGKYVLASDDEGYFYLWDAKGKLLLKHKRSFTEPIAYWNFSFDGAANQFAAIVVSKDESKSLLEVWKIDANGATRQRASDLDSRTIATRFDSTGNLLAVGVDRTVRLELPDQSRPAIELPQQKTISNIATAQFSSDLPYRWKVTLPTEGNQKQSSGVAFSSETMNWMNVDGAQWQELASAEHQFQRGPLSIRLVSAKDKDNKDELSTWVFKDNRPWTVLVPKHRENGAADRLIKRVAWCCDVQKALKERIPLIFAVANDQQADIKVYVIRDPMNPTCELTRVFRGHESTSNSLDCSPDFRYLLSSASDCTARIWSLDRILIDPNDRAISTWGCNFEVVDDQLTVSKALASGPLYGKGLREGDVLSEVSWERRLDGGTTERVAFQNPIDMQTFLETAPFDNAVRFIYKRGQRGGLGFQAYPHWREVATQIVAIDREWAMWTPYGIYDASFNGNSLFGWQVNRGMNQAPDFYRADRFQHVLERSDIMKRLLPEGSVDAALLSISNQLQGMHGVLENAIALTPKIELRSPEMEQVVEGDRVEVIADILINVGQSIEQLQAFANGVPAKVVTAAEPTPLTDGYSIVRAVFEIDLPSDENQLISVYASTGEHLIGAAETKIQRAVTPRREANKMLVVAAGISKYQDSRIPSLDQGTNNANRFVEAITSATADLYSTESVLLLDDEVNRSNWKTVRRDLQAKTKELRPDDILVLYLSGHGLADDASQAYYFVTADAKYRDIKLQNYVDCLSFEDIAIWRDAPCRKIVILDTCHSGAVQPLEREKLKQAVRTLQSDLVLTLTATEGDQLAAEYLGEQASVFTSAIIASLKSKSDENGDGFLDWPEITRAVSTTVRNRSQASKVPQFPTAGPRELLEYLTLPLRKLTLN